MGIVDFTLDFISDSFGALSASGLTYDLAGSGLITLGGTSVFVLVSILDACVAAGTLLGGSVDADCSTV